MAMIFISRNGLDTEKNKKIEWRGKNNFLIKANLHIKFQLHCIPVK